jgi:tRNA A-37 threonylcarbamoyl transferase component Bud32
MPELNPSLETSLSAVRDRQLAGWKEGNRVLLESLLADHPDLLDKPDVLLDLIYAELLLREEHGEQPDLEEYIRRFPSCEAGLRRQFAFHAAFGVLCTGAPETLPDATPGAPGQRSEAITTIGPYEILGEIGRGGMGIVYKGRHGTLNRLAAIKVLRNGADDAETRKRFLTEARAVAALQHPNIVRIHDVSDPEKSDPFVALEYIEGGNLADRIQGTPLAPQDAAALLLPLAEAIHHAHQRGILHRDLKPANVLLASLPSPSASGGEGLGVRGVCSPRITDFGLAKQIEADSSNTRTGVLLGTPSYMAPEQASGRHADVGPRTDVYGLGAILYEMLTGRPPFKADTVVNTINQVIEQEPVPPRSLQPSIPRDLDTICLKCLNKSPSGRYASAGALADDLRQFLQGKPILARPAGIAERAVKWLRRRPAAALLVGMSSLALAMVVVLWISFTFRLNEQKREAVEQRDEAIRQRKRAEREKEEARKQKEIALAERSEARKQSKRARHLLGLTATAVDRIAVKVRSSRMEETASGKPGAVLFTLACFYARTAKALNSDPDLAVEDGARLAEQYAVSAVRLLGCANQLGYFRSDRPANRRALETREELAILRSREDYKRLLAELR